MQGTSNPPNVPQATNGAVSTNGTAAAEMDRLLNGLRSHVNQLLLDQEGLKDTIRQLEDERKRLLETVAHLQEKCRNYAPIVVQWADSLLTREEAEAIVKKNEWVDLEEAMAELKALS
jgi:hypothetical protein